MSFNTERRTEAYGAPTPSSLRMRNKRVAEANARALRRYQIARAAASHPGSRDDKRTSIGQLIALGHILPGRLPDLETVAYLAKRWEAGNQTVEDYLDAPRSGRPRAHLSNAIEATINTEIREGRATCASKLVRDLESLAITVGVAPPTYYGVHSRIARAGRLVRSAARHGSRAGEFDGLPHGRFVTRQPHDTWVLDEFRSPVWVNVWDSALDCFVSARPTIILIIDVYSTGVVGYYVANPTHRIDEDGLCFRSGFDGEDVIAALLAAACPELATDATRPFAGFLPDRLRWDNAAPHKRVADQVRSAGIDVSPIRVRRAISQAAVERRNGIFKHACAGMLGHADDYLPTDTISESAKDLGVMRSAVTSTSNARSTRVLPILPENLLSLDEFCEQFDPLVAEYCQRRVNRMFNMTPFARYQIGMQPRPRNGRNLLHTLDVTTTTVTGDGITDTRGGVTRCYLPLIEGALLLLDKPVDYIADPVGRGIFVRSGNVLHFLREETDWSTARSAEYARNATSIARKLSVGAENLRRVRLASEIGVDAVNAAQEQYEIALQGEPNVVPQDEPLQEVFITPDPATSAEFAKQWAMLSPEEFVDGAGLHEEEA